MAHNWKPLPAELAESHRQLVNQLRELKEAAGLSYARLARQTPYSRSSWARFLNAEQVPTRQAAVQLGRVCSCDDPESLGQLCDRALRDAVPASDSDAARVDTAASSASAHTASKPRRLRSLFSPRLVVVAVVSALLGAAVATPLTLVLSPDDTARRSTGGAAASGVHQGRQADAATPSATVRCQGDACYHKDPQAMRCDLDARTLRVTWNLGMRVELRYSPACHAGWGHITRAKPGDVVTVTNRSGQTAHATVRIGHTKYTPMINARKPDSLWACGRTPRHANCTAH